MPESTSSNNPGWPFHKPWTKEEDDLLKGIAPTKAARTELASLLGRSVKALEERSRLKGYNKPAAAESPAAPPKPTKSALIQRAKQDQVKPYRAKRRTFSGTPRGDGKRLGQHYELDLIISALEFVEKGISPAMVDKALALQSGVTRRFSQRYNLATLKEAVGSRYNAPAAAAALPLPPPPPAPVVPPLAKRVVATARPQPTVSTPALPSTTTPASMLHQAKVTKGGITLQGQAKVTVTAQVDPLSPAGFSNVFLIEFVD